MSDVLRENLDDIEKRIQAACDRAGRARREVKLLLASKTVASDRLRPLSQWGYHLLGENTAQELKTKCSDLKDTAFEWHFIGHLQTNKVKEVVGLCSLIHSVDRLRLAEEISKRAQTLQKTMGLLIEVNTSGEAAKSGVAADEAVDLARSIAALPALEIRGLMTVAQDSSEEGVVKTCFRRLKQIQSDLQKAAIPRVIPSELSMGMSQDFEWAIEEGATLLRIGSLAFGTRLKK